MTQAGTDRGSAEQGEDDAGQPSSQRRNPYAELLRTPGALAFSSAGFVGRMSMSMYGLGTILLISSLTGRYGIAGAVAAAGAIGYAVVSPVVARWADRLGQRRVLLAQVSLFMVISVTFVACAELRAPFWLLIVMGTAAGALMPPVGTMVRTRWSNLVGQDAQRLHSAFAIESVNDELIFVVGPALVTLLATQVLPAAGLGAAIALCSGGTLLFALQRSTEPGPARAPDSQAAPGPKRARVPHLPTMPAAGLVTLAPAFGLLGAMFASIDVSTVAFATKLGHRGVTGLILGTYALGSAVGGLWYGSRHWRAPAGRRFALASAAVVAGVCAFWAVPGLLALGGVGFVACTAISPTLMTGYAILERQAPPHRRTEAMAWLSSTISVGVALGSAAAGRIIDTHGPRFGFGFAALCGIAGVAVCVAGLRRLRTPDDSA